VTTLPAKQASGEDAITLATEDELRAQLYHFLARFLSGPPSREELAAAVAVDGDEAGETELGKAFKTFSRLAERTDSERVAQEYHDLFIGVGRGELLPYGSYYLTGFLHEKPLAKLRNDMARFGIERDPDHKEPEDHIAALMDMMAGLITGEFGEPLPLDEQKKFFDTHIGSWARHFFADLEAAKSSVLYAALGTIGRHFMEIEETAFSMA
jgi:TorA maturation chaperone TorD